jgi:TetR/AcrR family transcriptional repressor of nem operon
MARGGRPREFVEDAVLDEAADLFWSQGYEATSMADIASVTGLGRQSVYNAFGDKRGVFLKALDRYRDRVLSSFLVQLEGDAVTPADVRVALLRLARHQARGARRGCLLLNASVELGREDEAVRERTQGYMKRLRRAAQVAVERAQAGGALEDRSPRACAESVVALVLGLHVMAQAGASERAMADAVEGTMFALLRG